MSDAQSDEWFTAVYLPQQSKNINSREIETRNRELITTWDYVKEDINQREEMGALKYGKYLTPSTTEDMLQHLYEELLDAVVYIKTEILKRKSVQEKRKAEQSAKVPR